MNAASTLLLSQTDVAALLPFEDYIQVVEEAFRMYAEGKVLAPVMTHVDAPDGEFHIKAGGLILKKCYFGLKVNGGFFQNMTRFGMPNIQGAIFLGDGENGYPLAIMDSKQITMQRTGAATAVAAKYLANPKSSIATICGCGIQGHIQLRALATLFPITKAFVYDMDEPRARAFATEMSKTLGFAVEAVTKLGPAVEQSHICVTCTPSKKPFLQKEYVSPGTFVSAVGADSPDKQELDSNLLKSNKTVVDIIGQCAVAGELHHALELGMRQDQVYAELGEVVAGKKPGRTSKDEIIIFDTTGTALQDVAAAAAVYEKAQQTGKGTRFDLFS